MPSWWEAAKLSQSEKKFSLALVRILGLVRLKIWDSLEDLDAMRFKQNRVTIENCSPGVFFPLVEHLGKIAKADGELGKLLWGENYEIKYIPYKMGVLMTSFPQWGVTIM